MKKTVEHAWEDALQLIGIYGIAATRVGEGKRKDTVNESKRMLQAVKDYGEACAREATRRATK